MFGIAVARLDQVSAQEKARYEALYCGLCFTLKDRYGQAPRAALSYDLVFLAILMGSLGEEPETQGSQPCASHPLQGTPFIMNPSMAYAADLSVALAYHKCLDDVMDEGTLKARGAEKLLQSHYQKARRRIPAECQAIEESMERIRAIENTPDAPPDDAAWEFGRLLGALFVHDAGFWEPHMRTLGNALGRFVYLMDAAVDLPEDEKSGAYNPLKGLDLTPDDLRMMLGGIALEVARAFEVLPLERDVHLLESVIYAGIWQKFNALYSNPNASSDDSDGQ